MQAGWPAIANLVFMYGLGILFLQKISPEKQVFGMWWVLKSASGFIGFIFILVVPFILYSRHDSTWWMFPVLGMLLMPGPEFIPKLSPHQKYISVSRLVLLLVMCNLIV